MVSQDSPRILIVDDEPRNRMILEELLEEFEIWTAASGQEALEQVPQIKPDVILLDVMMPHLDGFEVCRQLRAQPEHADTTIIFVSGKAMAEERKAGLEAGADDYVTKPFNHDELLAKIEEFWGKRTRNDVNETESASA